MKLQLLNVLNFRLCLGQGHQKPVTDNVINNSGQQGANGVPKRTGRERIDGVKGGGRERRRLGVEQVVGQGVLRLSPG